MQFERIVLNNFMRYKGTNKIEFSCDPEKNVTVVLGDNTVGKTTIAQAFRWGLYGEILVEKDKKPEDYVLLNKDVISMMDANSRAAVSVEISILKDNVRYLLFRQINYKRFHPSMKIGELTKEVKLKMGDIHADVGSYMEIEEKKIKEVINEMFPISLSHYFLFDGERWDDMKIRGMRENVKESVHKLTGLSATQQAMYHLKDMGSKSVISQMRGKIKGDGAIFDSLQQDIRKDEYRIDKLKDEIELIENNIKMEQKRADSIEDFLLSNESTEAAQKAYNEATRMVKYLENHLIDPYKELVNDFSKDAMCYFAEPMVERCLALMKQYSSQKENKKEKIPHIRKATIDYILNKNTCICGADLCAENEKREHLMAYLEELSKTDVDIYFGDYITLSNRWRGSIRDFSENMTDRATKVKSAHQEYEERLLEWQKMGKILDSDIDFAQKRKDLRECSNRIRQFSQQEGSKKGEIESLKNHIERLNSQISAVEAKTAENARWRERVAIAEELYKKFSEDFATEEKKTFVAMNRMIQENFEKMFNAKDKKIELDKHYNINMLYYTGQGFAEEKNLSEGEKIARNFAFIATIMSYEKEQKKAGNENVDTLPIILDAPFSKLGEENIELVAKALPSIAEQVIVFMLDKDWEYTKLDAQVGAKYMIQKAKDEGFASIEKMEG